MLAGTLDSAAWAKAMASFKAFMHAINIGARSGASVENIMSLPTTLSIRRPDDWHVHLRDGPMLAACAVHTARQFAPGIIMPNLVPPLIKRHQGLKVVLEHITTNEGVAFVEAHPGRLGGTITPHHLSYNRNAIFKGGIRPHFYCLPIAKREEHRLALRRAATSGNKAFFLGTDTAPHTADTKECACGCAGIFNAPVAMQVYAQVFMEENALDRLEAFASLNDPSFYGLPPNEERITLKAQPLDAPRRIELPGGNKAIVVFRPESPAA